MTLHPFVACAVVAIAAACCAPAHAQVTVHEPWVRATVPQQKASGLFAEIRSAAGGRLVAASSPVAGVVEIHEMRVEGGVMRMRAVAGVDLPAGRPVGLKPGGHHVMLMDLRRQLQAGEEVPVTLVVEEAGGQRRNVEVRATVRPLNAAAADAPAHKH